MTRASFSRRKGDKLWKTNDHGSGKDYALR